MKVGARDERLGYLRNDQIHLCTQHLNFIASPLASHTCAGSNFIQR